MKKYNSNKNVFSILLIVLLVTSTFTSYLPTKAFGDTVVTPMSDTVASSGLSTYSGRQIQAEFVTPTSVLVGKSIDTITVELKKVGSPTGSVQVGIFNTDLSVKQLIGTIDPSTVNTSYKQYNFSLASPQTYQIQSGDRIGIKYTGGDASNYVAIMTDTTNAFDSTNSYQTYYTTTWTNFTTQDLYMVLLQHISSTVPGSPTAVTPTPGSTQVALSWTAPASNGGSPITDYTIQYRTGANPFTTFADGISTTTGATVTGLTNGVSYDFQVSAVNSVGTGLPSTTASSTPVTAATVPGSPTAVTPTPGSTQVALSWTAPASNGGSPITDYTIQYRTGANPFTTFADGISTTTGATVTGLTNGVSYDFQVSAVNSVGTGLPSTTASSTPVTVPGSPTALTPTPGNTQVSLSWTAPASNGGSPITDYIIQYRTGANPFATFADGISTTTGATVTGLTNGVSYDFQVSAVNSVGTGLPSKTASATSTPVLTVSASPSSGTFTLPQSVTLSATAPSTIYYTTDSSTPTTSSTNGPSPLTLTINTNSTVKFFAKDVSNNLSPVVSVTYTINLSVVTQMSDTVASSGLSTYSGRQIQAEFVSPTSFLAGKSIDTITVQMKKVGAPTGSIQVGVFNTDLSVKQLIGTIDPSTLSTSYTQYTFSLAAPQTYQIQSGDRIGVKYTGGDTSNNVAVMTDTTNAFDSTNSYLAYYTTSWQTFTTQDLYMILKSHVYFGGPTVTASPISGTYTGQQTITLTASAPSTIYYTTDGSTPTTSSTNGPSPLSLTVSSTSTLKFFAKDTSNNVGQTTSASYVIVFTALTQMSDKTATFGISTFYGRPIQGEFVSPTSVLSGKSIDTIAVQLKKEGSPTGTVQVGVFKSDQSVKMLFGTIDASTLTTSYTQYTFSLASPQTYQLQSGDRIGIQYTGGDGLNNVAIMTDQVNSFDGTNSYLSYYLGGWNDLPTQDLYMILTLTHFPAPVITLTGIIPTTVEKGAVYVDPGAKASDVADGNLTSSIIITPNVNTNILGSYTVDYSVTNSHGSTTHASRPVQVVSDTTIPVITIRGVNPLTNKISSTYVDAGATALDAVSGNLTSSITTQSTVNTATIGTYTVSYTVSDQAGNTANAIRTVIVSNDNVPPVIALKGSNPLTIGKGIFYLDPGATATDNQDGNITGTIVKVNPVNTAILGTYTITYKVSDKAGNAATQVTRTVNVIDSNPSTSMNDAISTYGLETYSIIPIMGEFVSPTSSLVGKSIDTMTVQLQGGTSLTGTVQVGVFNADQSVKILFGTVVASTISSGSYVPYTFSLPIFQTYQIVSGDTIGIKYTGGTATNTVTLMTDQTNAFDGSNSYLTHFDGTSWQNDNPADVSMTLKHSLIPTSLPLVTPPQDVLSVTTNSTRNISDLGTPTITYNGPSPVVTNNSTGQYPIGTSKILWRATDSLGNIGTAVQKVTVISALSPTTQLNKVVMVNFDDSYDSIFTLGKPVLDKYNVKTTQYVICGTVGESENMNWSQVLQMQSEGHDMQSHTMTHFHGSNSTIARITYEYGQAKPCLTNNGTTNVHIAAMPYHEGYNNATVINIIAQYYEFSRGGTGHSFYLHCNDPFSTQTDCKTFDSSGNLNLFNRYNIRAWSSDTPAALFNYNDTISFGQFIQEVNSVTSNIGPNSTEIPIVLYHRVVQDNSLIPNPQFKGTTVKMLDAELKYLRDNNFRIYTTKDLRYDTVKNWFYLVGPTVTASPTAGTYNGPQSITLTASVPGTIYYTTDGSTPTTSSPNGSSPLTVTVSSTSTLKFFTKDTINNIGPISSAAYTIKPIAPSSPTGLTPTPGNTQVALSWTAPASNGGSPITDYVVEYRTGANSFTVFADGTSTSTGATVTGLTNGISYDFRVSAVNSVGTGLPSTTASSIPVVTPTVSALPPAGTYTSAQSVSLTASVPSTIYYTTDGSTPTTSSTNGPSPVSLIIKTNSTVKFFATSTSNNIVGPVGTVAYTINYPIVTQMSDTTASSTISTYSGRQIQAEFVSPTSSLVGKSIDTITVRLNKVGAPTGTVQVGVFNSTLGVKQLFGSISAASVSTTATQYSFSLSTLQTYQIQSGDTIGIKFTGGSSSNNISITRDTGNNFDGTNSYRTQYTTSWTTSTGQDLFMILKTHAY